MPEPSPSEKVLYKAKKDPEIVEIPETGCITISGAGAPGGPAYQEAVKALYGLAYTIRFKLKPDGLEFKVPALECLWWVEKQEDWADKDRWHWQMLIRLPEVVTDTHVNETKPEAAAKKGSPLILQIEYQRMPGGLAAQLLHVGPYSEEGPNLQRLHEFITEQGFRPVGHHQEIYLNDPSRTAPEKLKTILRQGVEKAQ